MPFWVIYVIWCVCVRTIVGSIDKVAHNILLHAWLSKLWLNTLNWVLWILHDDVAYHDPTLLLQYYCGFGTNYICSQMIKISIFFLERTIFWEGKWKICWNIKKTEINQLFRRRLLKLPMYHGIPLNLLEIVSMVFSPTKISCELYLKKFSM
jgi:hypothetical protein